MTKYLNRESAYPILPLILSRVSYRAFSEERLTEEELMSLFEAARGPLRPIMASHGASFMHAEGIKSGMYCFRL